ncbi:MAG TPA: DegT/DnrJ/EryC1/StrS family aminotransferase, partial [Phycisphaerae bacterium]|nr:DegT/DnrJ/EryC1/StrS family aminotransferase [Phycisphaerae bacterium]
TKAILPVEVFGNTAHFDEYERIAEKHGLKFIEDCCEALGAVLDGRNAGSFGDCGVFAFYPNKQITTGEGGMIVTDDEEIRDLCRSYRNQGRATAAWLSHARLGYNYRISELTAALGEVQASRLDEILGKRRRAAEMYTEELASLVGDIHLPPMVKIELPSWFVYVIRLDDRYPADARDKVMDFLKQHGIGCNNYFVPIHYQPYIRKMLGTKPGDFPVTERIAARTIALPFFSNLSHEQVCRVRDVLKDALASL